MQSPFQAKPVPGVIFDTTMSRVDSALALALLYGFESKKEAKVAGIAVNGSGFGSAAYCDVVCRFYKSAGGQVNSNSVLPIGLSLENPLPADPKMVQPALTRLNDKGEKAYKTEVHRITDTSEVSAMLRNAVTAQPDGMAVFLLSAPADCLLKVLRLQGARELIAARTKMLVLADAGKNSEALTKLLAEWPTPVFLCERDVGDAVPFPAESIEKDFAWAPAHPVIDVYRASEPMPYDAPSWDMAAALYCVRPDAGLFNLSEPGTIQAQNETIVFTPQPNGKHRKILTDPAQKEKIVKIYREMASAKPAVRQPRGQAAAAVKQAEAK